MPLTIPDARLIADRYLGQPYAQADCWDLVRLLYKDGFGIDLATDQLTAAEEFVEVWWHATPTDPLPLLRPWDLYILARVETVPFARHVGVVLDGIMMVHARENVGGVTLERCRHWRPRLLQVARWRPLA
jgi:cell wall-associated NlpC family hydrolase